MPPRRRRGRQPDVRSPLKGISKFAPKLCPPLHALVFLPSSLPPSIPSRSFDFRRRLCHSCLTPSLCPSVRPSLSPTHISPTLTFMVMTSNENVQRRKARAGGRDGGKDAFSSQNDGNCSSNDRDGDGGRHGRAGRSSLPREILSAGIKNHPLRERACSLHACSYGG